MSVADLTHATPLKTLIVSVSQQLSLANNYEAWSGALKRHFVSFLIRHILLMFIRSWTLCPVLIGILSGLSLRRSFSHPFCESVLLYLEKGTSIMSSITSLS